MSLSGYINDVDAQLASLRRDIEELVRMRRDIEELQRENKELKLNLDRRGRWGSANSTRRTRTVAEAKKDAMVEELIQSSTLDDYLKHGR